MSSVIQGAPELTRHIGIEVADRTQGPGKTLALLVQPLKVMGHLATLDTDVWAIELRSYWLFS